MSINRRALVQGMACASAGTALGAWGHRQFETDPPPPPGLRPTRHLPPPRGDECFSQSGEDRIVRFILGNLGISKTDYLDIGAHDPIVGNNTYLFYRNNARGVLVEPNVAMCHSLREARPGDTVLEAGIGFTAEREADFYVMSDSSWNTFSKEEAERQVEITGGKISIEQVIKMPLLDINQVMVDHFEGPPAFLSVDTQGLELAILESIDFARIRPKVICTETLVTGTRKMVPEIAEFMVSKGYIIRGMSFVNTIFVDSELL